MLKYFLLFSLFFFSCNKISESPSEYSIINNYSLENAEFDKLILKIKESVQFQELSELLFEKNFVSNSILDEHISIEQWNLLIDIPNVNQLDEVFPQERINNILQDNADAFTNYLTNFTTAYINLHDEFLVDLSEQQKLKVFLSLFKPPSDFAVVTRESCCAGCKAKYLQCNDHNDDTAMLAAGAVVLSGLGAAIYSGNPYAFLAGVVVGAVVGGVSHSMGSRHCYERFELCLSKCAEDCN